jgi:hypothetical protein
MRSSLESLLSCNAMWWVLHKGTCLRLITAIWVANQSRWVRFLSSRSFRTWCISTGVVTQIVQTLKRLDLVNFFVRFWSIISCGLGGLNRNTTLRFRVWGIFNWVPVLGSLQFGPNLLRVMDMCLSFYFFVRVNAQPYFRPKMQLHKSERLLAKV